MRLPTWKMHSFPTALPAPTPDSQIHRVLAALRLLGYASLQFCTMLVPLLVFQLTGNLKLAGLALFIELVPKLGFYLGGGAFLQRFHARRVYLWLEVARVLSLAALGACAAGFGSVWVVAAAAAVHQSASALSNIIFEQQVTRWWPPEHRMLGHATQMKQDQWGRLLALGAGLLVQAPFLLALIAFSVQLANLLGVARYRNSFYPETVDPAEPKNSFWRQTCADLKAANKPELRQLALITFLLGIPAALGYTALGFFLDKAQAGAAADAGWVSAVLLLRTGLSLAALKFVQSSAGSGAGRHVVSVGIALLLASAGVLTFGGGLPTTVAAMALLGTASCFYSPWMRNHRQAVLGRVVDQASRSGVTGVLLSFEVAAWLAAGAVMAVFGGTLWVAMAGATGLAACGAVLLLALQRAGLPPPAEVSPR